jgi:hypothetical protein
MGFCHSATSNRGRSTFCYLLPAATQEASTSGNGAIASGIVREVRGRPSRPGTMQQGIGAASSYSVLHAFGGSRDGAVPCASLLDESGTLYGITASGGKASQRHGKSDGGPVFTDPFVRESIISSRSSREVPF